jgi:hypothetical protein
MQNPQDLVIKITQILSKMKKIGILTFHRSINYGAFMQSYSLAQQLIKRYGNNVEIIDFEKASKHNAYHAKQNILQILVYGSGSKKMRSRFQDDLKILPLSDKSLITDNYDEVFKFIEGRYDVVIVGSDAVWAFNKGLGLKNPYWLFGNKLQCEKFSYAASAYSLDQSSLTEEDKSYIGNCLKSFTYIGVRDQETENLVKMCYPDAELYRNCDPTVLLPVPDAVQADEIKKRLGLDPRKRLITIMMARYEPIIYDIIRRLGRKNYQFVYFYLRMKTWERFTPYSPRFLYNLSPFEWYTLYRGAFMNLTTFFHGTLVALRSNVPTITFDTTSLGVGYITKIQQIMDDLSLSYLFNSYEKGIQKDRVFHEVELILNKHEEIASKIEKALSIEARKADSFFERLSRSLS